MPLTQRKRSLQLFRRLKFTSGSIEDESNLDMEGMLIHTLDCLGAIQCLMGKYNKAKAKVFWKAVATVADIGYDSVSDVKTHKHPGASHLLRAFPNEAKATDGRGWLPMHWAAVCDNIDPEDVKIIAKADPLATVKGYSQPISANPGHLIAAVKVPNMTVVKCLYDFYPRMAHTRDNEGDLPLHYAARCTESKELISYLLQANPSATKVRGDGDLIPLQCAVYNEHPVARYEIVKQLLQADPSSALVVNSDGDTTLHMAVDLESDRKLIQLLLEAYPAAASIANDVGMLPLHIACDARQMSETSPDWVNVVNDLVTAFPNATSMTNVDMFLPAHFAAQKSGADVFKTVISYNQNAIEEVSSSCGTPLHCAIAGRNEQVVKYICKNFRDCAKIPNSQGYLPLHVAAGSDNINILKAVYEVYPEAIRTFSTDGKLPLHFFSVDEYEENISEGDGAANILRFLIKAYPEAVNIPDGTGNTPFSLCRKDNHYCRRLFLRALPSMNSNEISQLNYEPRRMAMFLAFAAINADGEPCIWSRLRERNIEILKHAVSYL